MIMEDKFVTLFKNFDPELSSDRIFMSQLENRIRTVDLVRQQLEISHKKNRLAVIVAAITGFISGVISMVLYPDILDFINSLAHAGIAASNFIADYNLAITWSCICVVCSILVYTAYDVALMLGMKSDFLQQSTDKTPTSRYI